MTTMNALLTNTAYGFPRGAPRRIKPIALLCVHITGNSRLPSALDERNYANRALSGGPSAHDYIDRNGDIVHAIETRYAAWSNGDSNAPMTAVPGISAVVGFRGRGYNINEAYVREVECVGYPGTAPVTDAQLESVAQLIARDSIASGLPISTATVHTHAYINSVDRANCAFPPAERAVKVAALIGRAQAIKDQLSAPVIHTTLQETDPVLSVTLKLEDWTPDGVNGVFRATPDRSAPVLERVAAGTPVTSYAEVTTSDPANPSWRATRRSGRTLFMLRSDYVPVVQGGDPKTDALLDTLQAPRKALDCTTAVQAATTQLVATNDAQAAQITTLEARVKKQKDLAMQIETV